MTKRSEEIHEAIEEWGSKFWDEDHPEYDPDGDYDNLWDVIYYEEEPGYSVFIDGVGDLIYIDRHDDYDDGHALYVVFRVGDRLFQMQGWDDSWNGGGGWDGPLEEVEPVQVTKTEYRVIKED